MTLPVIRPFLKWAGGKFRLIERIKALLPPGQRLIEPFVGSGALFLNSQYPAYLLADANADLINLYQQLQHNHEQLIACCAPLFTPQTNSSECYYAQREQFNHSQERLEKAALFVYLNKHGFNGLCRYNASGGFNVPFGRHTKPYFPAAEMRSFAAKAQQSTFVVQDFATTLSTTQPGDVVYCDPPYVPLSTTANFTSYSVLPFGAAEQAKLAEMAEALAARGVPMLISNHDTPVTRELYAQARHLESFEVQRHISCDGTKRGKAAELIVLFQ
jgi:DNA adenine methylase